MTKKWGIFRRKLKLAACVVLVAVSAGVYRYGPAESPQWFVNLYNPVQAWAKEYVFRPEASWRQAAEKLNELLPKEGVPSQFDLTGRVVRVADGDTISILDANKQQHSIRFYGMDTPEYDQPYGNAASTALSDLLANETVGILVKDVDRLGRTVGIVYRGQTNINLEMIKNGHAWWYRQYASANRELKSAEQLARHNKLGLWSGSNPVPPWDWRRGKRQ